MEKRRDNLILLALGGSLALTLIISNFIVRFSFDIGGNPVLLSALTYPFIYLFSNLITAKYGTTKSLFALAAALLLQFFVYIINNAVSGEIVANDVILASASAYVVSTLINFAIFTYLLSRNIKVSFWMILLPFLFINLLDTYSFQQVLNTNWHFSNNIYLDTVIATGAKTIVSIIPATILYKIFFNKKQNVSD